jgi:hypothetical protein
MRDAYAVMDAACAALREVGRGDLVVYVVVINGAHCVVGHMPSAPPCTDDEDLALVCKAIRVAKGAS